MINTALLILITPLIGTLILLYLQNSSKKLTIIVSNISILFSFLLSVYLLIFYISSNASALSEDVLVFGDVKIYSLAFGLYIDSLSLVLLNQSFYHWVSFCLLSAMSYLSFCLLSYSLLTS